MVIKIGMYAIESWWKVDGVIEFSGLENPLPNSGNNTSTYG
jgi:hypothetical protein